MKRPSLLIIWLTVFIDLIGFGIVLPLLPIYSERFGASGLMIGGIMASYSLMQFIFAPIWGRLSDRIGRRPVLLVSTAVAALSYAVFAVGSSLSGNTALAVILISRVFAGICGANITVAQAYIADITPPEQRSKGMGLIGMAFGLGFIFGPMFGALGLHWFGQTGPGWMAGAFCAVNFLLAFAILGESWKPGTEQTAPRPRLKQWSHTLSQPRIGVLVGLFFLATFVFASFETTLGLLVGKNFNLNFENPKDAKTISFLFAYCGIIGAVIQGGAIGPLVRKLGEPLLIIASLVLMGIGLGALPFATGWTALLVALAFLSVGSSLTRPPLFGMISILTPGHEQGANFGVAQAAGSLARILAPPVAGLLFQFNQALPYLVCSAISLIAVLLAWQFLGRKRPSLPREPLCEGETIR